MKETTNYKLKKYEDADYADPSQAMNPNMDAIDAALKALEDGKASLGEGGTIPAEQLPDLDYEPPLKDNAAKATPADGDSLPLVDSADGGKTKRVLWSRIKAVLKTYFDPIYAAAAHSHAWSTITGKPSSFAPSAHASTHGSSGSDPITPAAIGAAASAHKHGAGDINSGTLDAARLPTVPVTRGGTGATTAAKALYALINGSFGLDYSEAAAGDFLALLDASAETGKKISLKNLINYMQLLGGVPKIATGSYIGTGTYGANNPCSLTFPFVPKLVVLSNASTYSTDTSGLLVMVAGSNMALSLDESNQSTTSRISLTWGTDSVSWHTTSAARQMNTSSRNYHYVAFG